MNLFQRELAALRQHDGETNEQLQEAREKIRKLTGLLEEVMKLRFGCRSLVEAHGWTIF